MAREILEMPVEVATMELPDTKTIRLKWPDGHNPEFKTGQFITCFWPDEPTYKRAYSLSSCARNELVPCRPVLVVSMPSSRYSPSPTKPCSPKIWK